MNLSERVAILYPSEAAETLVFLVQDMENLADESLAVRNLLLDLRSYVCGQHTYRETFTTQDTEHRDRKGQKFTVLTAITETSNEFPDEEVLPMFRIRFEDGHEIEAFPDEVLDSL